LGDGSIAGGADIEEIVSSLAHNVYQLVDDLPRWLPSVIELVIPPTLVQGLGHFEIVLHLSGRQFVILQALIITHELRPGLANV
jgi:hypothetical protein